MRTARIFVDSDVVISSLISTKGAAHLLLYRQEYKSIISNISKIELLRVVERLGINKTRLTNLIQRRLKVIKLSDKLEKIKNDFQNYAIDPDDAHIVAGAKQAKAKFLLTYNLRHFIRQKIKDDFDIMVLTPAQYLQYLRSLN